MKIVIAFFFLKNCCRVVWLANSFVFQHIPLLSPLATGHLCTGQIEVSTSSPGKPRANPGHLTAVHRARGGGNLNVALEGWGI